MQYRKNRFNDEKLSILGFGTMRLPLASDGTVDQQGANRIVRYGIDRGINYIDTAYVYQDGLGEEMVGRILQGSYRDRVKVATKVPMWLPESKADLHRILEEQLRRLKTDRIDYFLLHALNASRWEMALGVCVFDFLCEALTQGKILNVGFSHHDEFPNFKEIVDAYKWDFCQVQYNYMDENYQAGREGIEYAAKHNMSVMIMEPLRGGLLANVPKEVERIFAKSGRSYSPAEWALRWIWDQDTSNVVLSGMTSVEEVDANVRAANRVSVGSLSDREKRAIQRVKQFFKQRVEIPCTRCNYCMPCPYGVRIPECFAQYNYYHIFDDSGAAVDKYRAFLGEKGGAYDCVRCGACRSKCPQKIDIMDELVEVDSLFSEELRKLEARQ